VVLYDLDRRHAQSAVETVPNGGRWRLVEEHSRGKRLAQPKGHKIPSDLATRARGSAASAANAQAFAERLRPVLVELEGLSVNAAAKELDRRGYAKRAAAGGRPARLLTFAFGSACYEALPHIHP
jgi:hypothetical protein